MSGKFEDFKQGLVDDGHVRCYAEWSGEEEDRLARSFDAGLTIKAISAAHGRTRGGESYEPPGADRAPFKTGGAA